MNTYRVISSTGQDTEQNVNLFNSAILLISVFLYGQSGSGFCVNGESRVNHQITGEENKDAAEQGDR